jgi:hypothetical protein
MPSLIVHAFQIYYCTCHKEFNFSANMAKWNQVNSKYIYCKLQAQHPSLLIRPHAG